jgi:biopolymer transport protein TolR
MADINVTPLVDVMLVLLVIFMITAPLLSTGVQVDLPAAATGAVPEDDKPLSVSVDRRGRIFVQDSEVKLDALPARLQALKADKSSVRVFVRGDEAINYGQVMAVIAAIHNAGVTKVALLTRQPETARTPVRPRADGAGGGR